jgi:hypothetical protein
MLTVASHAALPANVIAHFLSAPDPWTLTAGFPANATGAGFASPAGHGGAQHATAITPTTIRSAAFM